jgi:hypothetical protein
VVDPQPVDDPLVHQAQQDLVGGREDLRLLGPQPDEVADGEEAPVVELGGAQPPPGEPVPLVPQQLLQWQLLGSLPHREGVAVVAKDRFTVEFVASEILQLVPETAAQHRQQDPPEPPVTRMSPPVDVEPPREGGVRPLPQHRPQLPVQMLGDGHGHMVRDGVHHQPEPELPRLAGQ